MCKTWFCGIAIITLCVVGLAYAADEKPAQAPAPGDMSEIQKVSYSVGVQMGTGLKKTKAEFDRALIFQGMQDALDGKDTLVSDADMKQAMTSFQQAMLAKRQEDQKRQIEENKAEQIKFLEENAKKEGVKTLPSGLQYKVLKSGTGKTPTATDKVKANYRGTLPDGTEFDSSEKQGRPGEFRVTGVIAGWTEALQLMKEGDKWQLFVPSELAYKDAGRPPTIPPAKMLVFEVELVEVSPPEAQSPAATPGSVTIPSQPSAPPSQPQK